MTHLITVKVQTRSKNPGIDRTDSSAFKIRVTAAPEKGRANREVIARLAHELGLPPSGLRIVRGATSSTKLIEVVREAGKTGR